VSYIKPWVTNAARVSEKINMLMTKYKVNLIN